MNRGERVLITIGNILALFWFIALWVTIFTGNDWTKCLVLWLSSEMLVLTVKVNFLLRGVK